MDAVNGDAFERNMALLNARREEMLALTMEAAGESATDQQNVNRLAINSHVTRLRLAAEQQQPKSCTNRRACTRRKAGRGE